MIGQAQTYAGARIVSTNTDGLYSVLDADLNRKILAKEAAEIGVEIVPEELYLVSKDSNNRLEASPDLTKILSASGSLGLPEGHQPDQVPGPLGHHRLGPQPLPAGKKNRPGSAF